MVSSTNVNERYVAQMRKELEGWPGFNYQNWQKAAQFCADSKINLDEALGWAEKAISDPFRGAAIGHEDFSTLLLGVWLANLIRPLWQSRADEPKV